MKHDERHELAMRSLDRNGGYLCFNGTRKLNKPLVELMLLDMGMKLEGMDFVEFFDDDLRNWFYFVFWHRPPDALIKALQSRLGNQQAFHKITELDVTNPKKSADLLNKQEKGMADDAALDVLDKIMGNIGARRVT